MYPMIPPKIAIGNASGAAIATQVFRPGESPDEESNQAIRAALG